jgi:hypothetical protein
MEGNHNSKAPARPCKGTQKNAAEESKSINHQRRRRN